jgi:hypothetical protein
MAIVSGAPNSQLQTVNSTTAFFDHTQIADEDFFMVLICTPEHAWNEANQRDEFNSVTSIKYNGVELDVTRSIIYSDVNTYIMLANTVTPAIQVSPTNAIEVTFALPPATAVSMYAQSHSGSIGFLPITAGDPLPDVVGTPAQQILDTLDESKIFTWGMSFDQYSSVNVDGTVTTSGNFDFPLQMISSNHIFNGTPYISDTYMAGELSTPVTAGIKYITWSSSNPSGQLVNHRYEIGATPSSNSSQVHLIV